MVRTTAEAKRKPMIKPSQDQEEEEEEEEEKVRHAFMTTLYTTHIAIRD